MAERRLTSIGQLDFTPRGNVFPSPADWRDQVLYELMIDRFDDAKRHPPFNPRTARRGRDPNAGRCFQGGNLRGVARRLDYLKGLGVTAIWFTCPLKNRPDTCSYHGYGIQDFLTIDPHFGTTADFQRLVREAHRRGMYAIMDIVVDHTGDVWSYANNRDEVYDKGKRYRFGAWRGADGRPVRGKPGPDDAVWPIELQRPEAFNRMGRMCHPDDAAGDEITDGDFMQLKVLDLEREEVLDAIIACIKYWIAVADIDGFRIDAFRHIRPESSARFCHSIREYAASIGKTNFIQIGEAAAGHEVVSRYIGSNTPLPGEGDHAKHPHIEACLDFVLYDHLDHVLRGDPEGEPKKLFDHYRFLDRYYRDFALAGRYFVTFVENHDQVPKRWRRFLSGIGNNRLGVLGAAYLLLSHGIPCLYYGSEQGFDGAAPPDIPRHEGGDQYVRECMFGGTWGAFDTTGSHFFNPEHPIYRGIAQVAAIRAKEPALRYGRQYMRESSPDGRRFRVPPKGDCTLAWSRVLDDAEVVVAMNLSSKPRRDFVLVDARLTPPGTAMTSLTSNQNLRVVARGKIAAIRVPLDGGGLAILKRA